jgi:hypothetical protein
MILTFRERDLDGFAVLSLNGPNIQEIFYDENGSGASQKIGSIFNRSGHCAFPRSSSAIRTVGGPICRDLSCMAWISSAMLPSATLSAINWPPYFFGSSFDEAHFARRFAAPDIRPCHPFGALTRSSYRS